MLVEIPDPEVIVGGVIAFLVGVFGLYLYYKIKPYVNLKAKTFDSMQTERLEYYERQLIDMKIKLDALDLVGLESRSQESPAKTEQVLQKTIPSQKTSQETSHHQKEKQSERVPNLSHNDVVEYVLGLVTDQQMTSRDIQITVGRSREHVSRLMKKLYQDGLVDRNTSNKPFTYLITEKGKKKLGLIKSTPVMA